MPGSGLPQVAARWKSCRSILEIKVGLQHRGVQN